MKNTIKILPTQDSNKISAGYVIKRPASVVKELLENSIDAHSKNIKLILLNGGKDLINVIDDGDGMNHLEAKNSIRRFYTSKLYSLKDIKSLNTKGFRGEALYYISLVSQVEIYTKKTKSEFGVFLTLENQKLKYPPVLLNNLLNGTSIYVKNLFYNFPNRKNFLKSAHIELRYIISEFNKIVLSHPDINFVMMHNNKIITSLKKSNLKYRIIKIFGEYYKNVLIKVFKKDKLFLIKGYITSTSFFNTQFKNYYLFVNNRYVVNKRIHKSIIKAYNGLINKTNKPNYFLFLTIPTKQIEINICQSKNKILIKSESEICKNINIIIKEYLGLQNIFKFYSKKKDKEEKNRNLNNNCQEFLNKIFLKKIFLNKIFLKKIDLKKIDLDFTQFKIYKKYILCLLDFGVLIIHKDRVYKIILEDKFKKEIKKHKIYKLYPPINIKLNKFFTKKTKTKIIEILINFGFKIKCFENSISITYSPKFLKKIYVYRLLYDLYIYQDDKIIEKLIYKNIYNFYKLETKQKIASLTIRKLIKQILKIDNLLKFKQKILFLLDINNIEKYF
ncbi:DNA mismatch repair protein mutL [Candidatus Karelsulcia muelleri]|uniref:DNA mismatch repair endonuclease MutL n=1 Tax=Candidatus Karelsulcia muelleri TaxID=336810 RepID=UPI001FF228CB|nr:DNA mismatch repair endonuclease MutL [Candidatus Karelsulcia muelleri]UOQ38229.1 DNA mismatch repair protein mutL [Candidatus Karelsulcia muelleri]